MNCINVTVGTTRSKIIGENKPILCGGPGAWASKYQKRNRWNEDKWGVFSATHQAFPCTHIYTLHGAFLFPQRLVSEATSLLASLGMQRFGRSLYWCPGPWRGISPSPNSISPQHMFFLAQACGILRKLLKLGAGGWYKFQWNHYTPQMVPQIWPRKSLFKNS